MSEAFRGEFNQKVDSKARVSIPAAFRRILEAGDPDFNPDLGKEARAKFVLVYGGDKREFLECYTVAEMRELEKQIVAMPKGTKERRILERNMITLTVTLEIDSDGRIVLPSKARDKIELTADLLKDGVETVFAGTLDTFQIWRADTFEAAISRQAEEEIEELKGGADILSLLPPRPAA
ncbi:division/cell wall cluster transcriptional repressor MraZ [Fertoebacter nigrum]|uniref:Transcriptional regulator MraZ n=1 Tax=Fertoeibacter niger TaxID=2656921 RepID=A0A8X8KN92_9RHOB|nr:division/cell wall cluster transcriptional repressor MraZ [Fertoeibacter niger]